MKRKTRKKNAKQPERTLADLTFEPMVDEDGELISFDCIDLAYIEKTFQHVQLAFATVTKTKEELTDMVRQLLEDDVQDVLDALDAYDDTSKKLQALSDICGAAFARMVVVAEPLEDKRIMKRAKKTFRDDKLLAQFREEAQS